MDPTMDYTKFQEQKQSTLWTQQDAAVCQDCYLWFTKEYSDPAVRPIRTHHRVRTDTIPAIRPKDLVVIPEPKPRPKKLTRTRTVYKLRETSETKVGFSPMHRRTADQAETRFVVPSQVPPRLQQSNSCKRAVSVYGSRSSTAATKAATRPKLEMKSITDAPTELQAKILEETMTSLRTALVRINKGRP